MASCWNFSLIDYKDRQLRKSFEAAGLESRMIEVDNGSTIHCWVPKNFAPASGEEDGAGKPVLVLLHGFGASATWQWEQQAKPLLQHFSLVIPDLVFFGLSTSTSSERSESFQAESIWLVLSHLGIRKFSVVGTSYGGFVAYRIAQAHENAVEKLVLSNSSVCMIPEDDRSLCKRGGAASIPELLLPTDRAGLNATTNLAFSKPAPNWFIPSFIINCKTIGLFCDQVLYGKNRAEKVELLQKLVFGKENAPSLMTKVDKDILMIWGDNDKVFPLVQAERAKDYLGDRVKLIIIKDAGHVSQLEHPEQWNELVVNFILGK